jgi:hypothetical protein
MEVTHSSGTLVDFHRTSRRYIPEDRTLLNHHYENSNPTKVQLLYLCIIFLLSITHFNYRYLWFSVVGQLQEQYASGWVGLSSAVMYRFLQFPCKSESMKTV